MPLPNPFPKSLWESEESPIWLSSSLSLQRNLTRYKFPAKLPPAELQQVAHLIQATLPLSYFPAETLTNLEKEYLLERFLFQEIFQQENPGQAIALDEGGSTIALINGANHLELLLTAPGGDLAPHYFNLSALEKNLAKSLAFAFSPKFGYLTANPARCGTALTLKTYLHLPALIHQGKLQEALSQQKEKELAALSLEGPLDSPLADIVVLTNKYTLGINEEALLRTQQIETLKLVAAEKMLRSHLEKKCDPMVSDLIGRAYGLLRHSSLLQTKETLGALSLLKLGVDLKQISGITHQEIGKLLFTVRKAHLTRLLEGVGEEELAAKRAELLQQALNRVPS